MVSMGDQLLESYSGSESLSTQQHPTRIKMREEKIHKIYLAAKFYVEVS